MTADGAVANGSSIGIFDSGIGGLAVMREVRFLIPGRPLLYLADQRWAPYGSRSLAGVQERSIQVAGQLIEAGAGCVVVACNTASAAALHELRRRYVDVPFVGMEPAVKPAASHSRSRVVGVLATAATFQGELFASVVDRHADDVTVLTSVGEGLAGIVEDGGATGSVTKELLRRYLGPMLDAGMDTLVLGCTHYTFLTGAIRGVVGDDVRIIDPAPAVARQVVRVSGSVESDHVAPVMYATTADPDRFDDQITELMGSPPERPSEQW